MKSITAFATIALVVGLTQAFPKGPKECGPEGGPGCRPEEPPSNDFDDLFPKCPEEHTPICGRYGPEARMFQSACIMDSFNFAAKTNFQETSIDECNQPRRHVRDIEHERTKEKDCPPCPRIYLPVCGSDGYERRTFSNECMVDFFNCIESRDFEMLRSGEC